MKTALKDLIEKLQKFRLIKEDENSYELFRQLELESLEKEKEQIINFAYEILETSDEHQSGYVSIEEIYNKTYNQNK
jgi:hypothetical protein